MKVRYTPRARADLEAIYDYIDQRNPKAALAVKSRIQRAINSLSDLPLIGRPTDRMAGLRVILAGRYPYRIYYRVRDNVIWIAHIRHTARRLPGPGGI